MTRQTTLTASGEYYPRRSLRGKIVLVRNANRRQTMMDKLSNPYAQGIYTGAAAVGLITGMAMMARRGAAQRQVSALQQQVRANFGYNTARTYRWRSKILLRSKKHARST
jgi:hypothetical protein